MNFCAFLRGVNVNGTNIKMLDVVNLYQEEGLLNVSSVLASGNILFQSDKSAEVLKPFLEKKMSERFGYQAYLFIKNQKEIAQILEKNPYTKNINYHIYVFIGVDGIEEILMDVFSKLNHMEQEEAAIINNNFYWQVKKGETLNTDFGKILGKKSLKDSFTSRNIQTLEKIMNKFL